MISSKLRLLRLRLTTLYSSHSTIHSFEMVSQRASYTGITYEVVAICYSKDTHFLRDLLIVNLLREEIFWEELVRAHDRW